MNAKSVLKKLFVKSVTCHFESTHTFDVVDFIVKANQTIWSRNLC